MAEIKAAMARRRAEIDLIFEHCGVPRLSLPASASAKVGV
jgi:hypothetical protein